MKNSISILYVEDDSSVCDFVKVIFEKNDIQNVTFASNGEEALDIYTQKSFDLVITDMIMPIINGFELIEHIKKINDKQIFIMVTGLENRNDLIRAIELHINYFIAKPIRPKKFMRILNESFELVSQQKEAALNQTLLSQYKSSIDETAIVSKSDKDGNITYVNPEFCKISKYSAEELLGQNHRILRSQKTPQATFIDMWKTISSKKRWQGIITNRAKDGTEYVVNSVIIPLLDLNDEIIEYISIRHDITELELYKEDLKAQLDLAVSEIVDTQKEIVYTMGAIGETRSKETGNHVKRVANHSYTLARLAGLSEEESELLRLASPMHDIGKVGIPDNILNKPGKLDFDEFEIMKTHAELGYDMLKNSQREILKTSAIVAYEHHEKWDGSGYPRALKGEEIHIYGRITAICDVFDALGADRCYKKAWPLEKILDLLKDGRGTHFDASLINLFLENIDKFLEIQQRYKD
ncbi:response regulator [Sulfurimonas sp. SAG-AH-194-C21]|nr:HD domain-containing phosphohydrolase [Sulfurimonas sp. SAG-AH-194-C21]MDF1882346.1 response regulator [Sulfurimonas sp. SAG-AH-194-C21]